MKIDKNIPIPKSNPVVVYKGSYDFSEMEPGDSVLIEGEKNHSLRCKIWHVSRYTGRKFVTKKEGDNTRIWRIS